MTKRVGWALWFLLLLALPLPVAASPLFELVGSGLEGGFNARGTGPSAASTYFNPALLPRARQGLELGGVMLNDAISVRLAARSRADDVPLSALERVSTDQPPIPTDWLEHGCSEGVGRCARSLAPTPRQGSGSSGELRGYQLLGLVNHLLGDRLSIGLYALVPLKSFTSAHSFFVDEREQSFTNSLHPELYSDRLTPISLAFGAGSRVFRDLYLGLSFTLGLDNSATAGAYVGNSRLLDQTLQLSTRVDVETRVSPHGGLTYELGERGRVSLTLHSPQKIVIGTRFGIVLPNGDVQYAERKATHAYVPWICALAASYDLSRRAGSAWDLVATVTFERWSRYLNRQTERPRGEYAFRDIATGVLGLHHRRARWSSLLDVSFRPSPVPEQTGRTNYVDNARYGALVGTSYEHPIPAYDVALRFGVQAQVHGLPARSHQKRDPRLAGGDTSALVRDEWPDDSVDPSRGEPIAEARGLQTNNPGWPGFSSRGFILGAALTLSLLY